MALFRQTGARSATRKSKPAAEKPAAANSATGAPRPRRRIALPGGALRFVAALLGGIAVMAVVGYFVAAIWLFPAPLLPSERMVPRVIGMTQREATAALTRAGFASQTDAAHHVVATRGTVVWQDPPPGTAVPRQSTVRLTISSGPPWAVVPSVEGMDVDLASRLIAAVGLHVTGVDTIVMKTHASALAASTNPPAGDTVPMGRGVILHLAR